MSFALLRDRRGRKKRPVSSSVRKEFWKNRANKKVILLTARRYDPPPPLPRRRNRITVAERKRHLATTTIEFPRRCGDRGDTRQRGRKKGGRKRGTRSRISLVIIREGITSRRHSLRPVRSLDRETQITGITRRKTASCRRRRIPVCRRAITKPISKRRDATRRASVDKQIRCAINDLMPLQTCIYVSIALLSLFLSHSSPPPSLYRRAIIAPMR